MTSHRGVAACLGASVLVLAALTGCQDLVSVNYQAVDKMIENMEDSPNALAVNQRVLVGTFVNVDDVQNTSTLGRTIGQICGGRLVHHGYPCVLMNLRTDSVVINPAGEFFLSRDIKDLSKDYNAQAVLVGTYTRSYGPWDTYNYERRRGTLYVSMKLVRAEDSAVVAAYDYAVPVDENIDSLLAERVTPPER